MKNVEIVDDTSTQSNTCSGMMVGENKDGPAPALTGVDPGLTHSLDKTKEGL